MQENINKPTENFEDDSTSLCPICSYYAGSALTCPRCGARVKKRISIKIVRIGCIIGSIIGVILLWFAAYLKQPQMIFVSDIDPMMNGALVTIHGKVTSYRENLDRNTFKLKIDDGTGEIAANGFNKLSQFKKVLGENMPELGDEVEIVGSINVSQKFGSSMFLSIPDRVKIIKKFELKKVNIGDLTRENVGDIVLLQATITDYLPKKTRKGSTLHIFTLSDKTGSIEMTLFETSYDRLKDKTKKILKLGNKIEIEIKVGEYRGKLQANLVDESKLKKLGKIRIRKSKSSRYKKTYKESKGPKSISDLTDKDVGSVYEFHGQITYVKDHSKGKIIRFDDGTDEIMIMLWATLKDQIKGYDLIRKGGNIRGEFLVYKYKDQIRVKTHNPKTIVIE